MYVLMYNVYTCTCRHTHTHTHVQSIARRDLDVAIQFAKFLRQVPLKRPRVKVKCTDKAFKCRAGARFGLLKQTLGLGQRCVMLCVDGEVNGH